MSLIKEAIIITAEYYGRQLSESVLSMYASDLADLQPEKVYAGYAQYRRNPANRTFPLPAQIRELVAPEECVSIEARAREIASRIVGAVPKFGWCNAKEAQIYIGPDGWDAVQRNGGWSHLCENMGRFLDPTTFQAQLRDQLEGSLRYGSHAIEASIHALPQSEASNVRQLESAGAIMQRLLKGEDDNGPKAS